MGKNTYKFNGIECMENQYLFLIEIKDLVPKNILDIITKPGRDDWMLYNYEQMCEIYNGYKNGLSETDINMYAKINSYKLPMYSAEKMCYIKMALLEPTIYSRQLSKILAVTSEERPLYSLPTTKAIMSGCKHGLSDEEISLYTQLDSKHRPLFTGEEAVKLEKLIRTLDKKQYIQLKESIEDEMTFDQFTSYIKKDISAEKMRVYRALMKLGCDTDDIGMFEYMKVDYNTLKNVKYVMQMNAYFNLGRNARAINSSLTGNDLAENIAYRLQEKRDFDNETKSLVQRCLNYRMEPEQIDLLIDSSYKFDKDEMKDIVKSFLEGLSVDDVKNAIKESTEKYEVLSDSLQRAITKKHIIGVPDEDKPEIKTESHNERSR